MRRQLLKIGKAKTPRTNLQQMIAWIDAAIVAYQWNVYYHAKDHKKAQNKAAEFRVQVQDSIIDFFSELHDKCGSYPEFRGKLKESIEEIRKWPIEE